MLDMSLDDAQAKFEVLPDRNRASRLLSIATQYWHDGMIGDDTYVHKVGLVQHWLAGDRPKLPEGERAHCNDSDDEVSSHPSPVVELRFRPQAWVNDWAIAIDSDNPDSWIVPLALFLKHFPTEEDWARSPQDRDDMRFEGNPPKWIRDWPGPFEVDLADCAVDPWAFEKGSIPRDSESRQQDWPLEAAIRHNNGAELRVPAYPEDVSYIRVVCADGTEIAYWSIEEIAETPADTIGAIIGAVIGGRRL